MHSFDFFSRKIWNTLISVRLTITLLISLTLFSVAGTLIAQQGTTQVPIEKLYSIQTLKWLHFFGLTDIYHSAFFVFLIFLLALNLISCSIERLPKVWREAFYTPPFPLDEALAFDSDPELAKKRKYLIQKPDSVGMKKFETTGEAKMATLLFFKDYFGHYRIVEDQPDRFQIQMEKGKYSRLGVYITHLSLLTIMFGASLGSIFGFEGMMNIEEGSRISWITHLKGSQSGLMLMREKGVPVKGFLNLGFEVECERFTLETYDGERPKAFRSRLNFYENDVQVHSADIEVNHPTVYKGLTFYQASFNKTGVGSVDLKVFRVDHRQRNPSAQAAETSPSLLKNQKMPKIESVEMVENVKAGDLYRIDGDAAFKVIDIQEDLLQMGPAAKIQFFASKAVKKPREFWVFKNLPGFDFAHRKGEKLHFVLDEVRPKYETGLSVAKDPGVWVVWGGSALMILAIFIALYTVHCKYWICYSQEKGFRIAGWANKLFIFEPRYKRFFDEFCKRNQT